MISSLKVALLCIGLLPGFILADSYTADIMREPHQHLNADKEKHTLFIVEYAAFFLSSKFKMNVHTKRNGNTLHWNGNIDSKGLVGSLLRVDSNIQGEGIWNKQTHQVIPIHFSIQYTKAPLRNISYRFDFDAGKAYINKTKNEVNVTQKLDISPDIKDMFSIHLQLIVDAQKGKQRIQYALLSKDEIKQYLFVAQGEEMIPSAYRETSIKAVRYHRLKNDKVVAHYWLSVQDGYLPVQVETLRKGKVSIRLTAQKVQIENTLLAQNTGAETSN